MCSLASKSESGRYTDCMCLSFKRNADKYTYCIASKDEGKAFTNSLVSKGENEKNVEPCKLLTWMVLLQRQDEDQPEKGNLLLNLGIVPFVEV